MKRPSPADIMIMKNLTITLGAFGILSFLLNLFVICRILHQNIRRAHQSKLYFFSLAIADLMFGSSCFVYNLIAMKVVLVTTRNGREIASIWWAFMSNFSYIAGFFHIIAITVDRFIATKFPLFHKVNITRRIVIIATISVWLFSMFLTSTSFWQKYKIADWFIAISGIVGTFMLIITYIHITKVAINRKKTLQKMTKNRMKENDQQVTRSINTTYLSITITAAFILCNLTYSIAQLLTVTKKIPQNNILNLSIFLLLLLNTVVDPIIYTVVECIHKEVMDRRISRQTQYLSSSSGTNGRKITQCTLADSDLCLDRKSSRQTQYMSSSSGRNGRKITQCTLADSELSFDYRRSAEEVNPATREGRNLDFIAMDRYN